LFREFSGSPPKSFGNHSGLTSDNFRKIVKNFIETDEDSTTGCASQTGPILIIPEKEWWSGTAVNRLRSRSRPRA
jgi:hypothetical protein